jgi:uncharacterized SAM-binding protein YcdF (DUF218 family)
MAKRPAPHQGPRELEARAALAVLYWRRLENQVPIFCVEGYDLPGSPRSGAEVVAQFVGRAGVPQIFVATRAASNCTSREVLALRDLLDERQCRRVLVITHPYHEARTRLYLEQVGIHAQVIGCTVARASELAREARDDLMVQVVARGERGTWNALRERAIEILLIALHKLDPGGSIEQFLADRVRS